MKRVLRKDVAQLANVSETTVSVVLNNNIDIIIAEETRQRVFDAAKQLGYYPHHAARTMAGKKSRTIGVISPWNARVWFFSEMLNGIRQSALEANYGVLLCNILKMQDSPEDCIRYYKEGRIDGVVYMPPDTRDMPGITDLRDVGIPVVICNGIDPYGDMGHTVIDYAEGIYKAAGYLYHMGFQNLLYILPNEEKHLCSGDAERLRGFSKAADGLGFKMKTEIININCSVDERLKAVAAILDKYPKPLGIVSCYWYYAYYFQTAAVLKGLAINRDLMVIAGDIEDTAEGLYPAISGIKLPFHELGQISTRKLIGRLEGMKEDDFYSAIEGEYPFLRVKEI
jgi:LacI family transcriptional regulator